MYCLIFQSLVAITGCCLLLATRCFGHKDMLSSNYEYGECSMYDYDPRIPPESIPIFFDAELKKTPELALAFCRNADMSMNRHYTKNCCWRAWGGKDDRDENDHCLLDNVCPKSVFCQIPADSEDASLIFEHCCGGYIASAMYTQRSCMANGTPSKAVEKCGPIEDKNEAERFMDPECELDDLQFIASFCRKDELDHADYFTTLYCCRKYQRVYDTKFMYEVESSSRKPRCVWSRDHPIYSWIMHSKMSACCTSLDRTVDYSMPTVSNLVTTRKTTKKPEVSGESEGPKRTGSEASTLDKPKPEDPMEPPFSGEVDPDPCWKANDLIIVVDFSGSSADPKYAHASDFAMRLAATWLANSESRVGIITFSPKVETIFELKNPLNENEVNKLMTEAPSAEGTHTHLALDEARVQFEKYSRAVPKNIVFMTDGQTKDTDKLHVALNGLRNEPINVFPVGIGPEINDAQLIQIALDKKEHVFTIDQYDRLHLLHRSVSLMVCNDQTVSG